MRLGRAVLLLAGAIGWQAAGQALDSSGNGLLKGTYYFRQVVWAADNSGTGNLGEALAIYGNINFDGNGNYTLTNTLLLDGGSGQTGTYNPIGGTYVISASGAGYISSPAATYLAFLTNFANTDFVYGTVSAQGYFVGSASENKYLYNDLMIAAPLASPAPTLATFKGNYMVADFDVPGGSPSLARDSLLTMNPDGNGTMGTVTATGYISYGITAVRQSLGGVKYLASNGAYNVQLGGTLTNANLIAGNHYLYISPDGNFVFGGSPNAWDMMVGVRTGAAPVFSGTYYQGGLDMDVSNLVNGNLSNNISYFGSLKALGGGVLLGHQRTLRPVVFNQGYDFTYGESFSQNADGSIDLKDKIVNQHYVLGAGGMVRIGVGNSPYLGIHVAFQAPVFSTNRPDVFLDPTGVGNAASSALFTSGIAPGELITLYGANLAPKLFVDYTFPKSLGGVQVLINGIAAPILYVSATLVEVMVPYETSNALISSIQVVNAVGTSNTVTVYNSLTSPGLFTVNAGGLGQVWSRHADSVASQVTTANPAKVGETIYIAVNGLGLVTPAINTGDPGPIPAATAFNNFLIFVDGLQAAVTFQGLTPTAIGLGQFNLTIPAGVHTGDVTVEVIGPDSDNLEGVLAVSSTVFTSLGQPSEAAPQAVTSEVERPYERHHQPVPSRGAPPRRVVPGNLHP